MSTNGSLYEILRSRGVVAKKVGREISIVCPFHDDTRPSLFINEEKGVFYCHGCHARGNIADLLIKGLGIRVDEARKILMEIGRGDLITSDPELAIFEEFFDYAQKRLTKNSKAIEFFKNRGYDIDFIESMPVGYAPRKWPSHLPEDIGRAVGLLSGSRVFLGGRIIFPMFGPWSIIGMSGRTLSEKGEKKYLIAGKRGLYRIGNGKVIYLVEGPMDALRVASFGYPVIARVGSRLSEDQITYIKKMGLETIVFIPDNDRAGILGALSDAIKLITAGVYPMIIPPERFGEYKDIDEYGKNGGIINDEFLTPISIVRYAAQRGYSMILSEMYRSLKVAPIETGLKVRDDFIAAGEMVDMLNISDEPVPPDLMVAVSRIILTGEREETEELIKKYGLPVISRIASMLTSNNGDDESKILRNDAEKLLAVLSATSII